MYRVDPAAIPALTGSHPGTATNHPAYRSQTLETVKHHLKPNRQRSVEPRHVSRSPCYDNFLYRLQGHAERAVRMAARVRPLRLSPEAATAGGRPTATLGTARTELAAIRTAGSRPRRGRAMVPALQFEAGLVPVGRVG